MEALLGAAPAAAGNRAAARGLLRIEDVSPEFKKLSRVMEVTRSDVDFLRSSLIQQGAHQLGRAGVGPGSSDSQAGHIAQLHLDVRNVRDCAGASEIEIRDVSGRVAITEDAIRELALQCDSHRKDDAKTSGNAFDKLRAQAEGMDIRIEAGKGELHGRIEEIWGFVRAMDEDQSTTRKAVAEARERLVMLADEVSVATRAEAVRAEIKATKEMLEGRLALQRQELEASAHEQSKAHGERQAKSLAEINRIVRAVDQRLQTTRKEHQDSQRKAADQYSERETRLTTELDSRFHNVDSRLDKAVANIAEAIEKERVRSDQGLNDSRSDHTRMATRVDCVAACNESLVSNVNELEKKVGKGRERLDKELVKLNKDREVVDEKFERRMSELSGQQQQKRASVHAHLESTREMLAQLAEQQHSRMETVDENLSDSDDEGQDLASDVEALSASLDNLAKSQCALQEKYSEVAHELEAHRAAAAQSEERIGSEIERFIGKEQVHSELTAVRSELAKSICTVRAELEDCAGTTRAEVASSAAAAQVATHATKEELLRALEREAAAVRQLLSMQCDGHAEELEALREDLESGMNQQSRRSHQLDARMDEFSKQTANEVSCALHAQGEKMVRAHAALEVELRKELSMSERRTAALVDESLKRGAEVNAGVVQVRNANALERDCVQQHLGKVEELARRALAECSAAASRASASEAAIARMTSDTRADGVPDAFVNDVRVAMSSLTAGIVKVAQCCGFLGGLREGQLERIGAEPPVVYLPAGHIGLKELIEWEGAGVSLSTRIERAWAARSSAQSLTLLEALQQKADSATVRMVQAAVRETTGRLAQAHSQEHTQQGEVAPCSVSWVQGGPPCVGAFGAHSRKSKTSAAAPLTPRVAPSTSPEHASLPVAPATLSARSQVELEELVPEYGVPVPPELGHAPLEKVPGRPAGLTQRVAPSTLPVHASFPEAPATLSARTRVELEERMPESIALVAPELGSAPPERVPGRPAELTQWVAPSTLPLHASLPEAPATLSARTQAELEERVPEFGAPVVPVLGGVPPERVPGKPSGLMQRVAPSNLQVHTSFPGSFATLSARTQVEFEERLPECIASVNPAFCDAPLDGAPDRPTELTQRVTPSTLQVHRALPETLATLSARAQVEVEERVPNFGAPVAPQLGCAPSERAPGRPAGPATDSGPLQRRVVFNPPA